jgi:hypothetical protein
MRRIFLYLLSLPLLASEPAANNARRDLLRSLAHSAELLKDVPFSEVIAAVTGKQALPFLPQTDATAELIHSAVSAALTTALQEANAAHSPLRKNKRINETSKWFEDRLCELLSQTPGFTCTFPTNAEGHVQRSGYPDIRLQHTASGRVTYLDPKVHAADSARSSLRTFYYQPSQDGGKVREDAHHLILGIAHEGAVQKWVFTEWKIVDVSALPVSLKAEFDAGNDDLYTPSLSRGTEQVKGR